MTAPRVVVVGGGITGLAAAYYLQTRSRAAGIAPRITLLEQSAAVGGKVGTEMVDGLLIDTGPDSFLSQKPWALELCRELGIADDVITPRERRFYMLLDGRLHEVPHELVSLVPTRPEALWKASFLSLRGKLRASLEGLVPARKGQADESLSGFMRRRFGVEFALRFAEPLMGGVHAGNPEQMSMASIYPMYWAMEQQQGSVTRAILQRRAAAGAQKAPAGSPFVALQDGMQSLVDCVAASLGDAEVQTGACVQTLAPRADGTVEVRLGDGPAIEADCVILTTPAFVTAGLVAPFAPEAARGLRAIPYASTAVVSLAYRRSDIDNPLQGTGFLAPRIGSRGHAAPEDAFPMTGCTWSSNKWAGRAPEDIALMRAFVGYAGHDAAIRDLDDGELQRLTHERLASLLGIRAEPVVRRVHRWIDAMPQYEVGHQARVSAIAAALSPYPGIAVAGSAYRGVGVPDCVRQGKEAAEALLARLTGDAAGGAAAVAPGAHTGAGSGP